MIQVYSSLLPNFFAQTCSGPCGRTIRFEILWRYLSGPYFNGVGRVRYACQSCCKSKSEVEKLFVDLDKPSRPPRHPMTNQKYRERTGSEDSYSLLVSFLYTLIRDEVPPGVIERIMIEVEKCDGKTVQFTNGFLARYAKDIAERLGHPDISLADPRPEQTTIPKKSGVRGEDGK